MFINISASGSLSLLNVPSNLFQYLSYISVIGVSNSLILPLYLFPYFCQKWDILVLLFNNHHILQLIYCHLDNKLL